MKVREDWAGMYQAQPSFRCPGYLACCKHQISNTDGRHLRDRGLTGDDLTESGCERAADLELNPGDAGEAQAKEADPDSGDPTSRLVCFHVPSLVLLLLRALIDKTWLRIDESDAPHSTAQEIKSMSTARWLAETPA